MTHKHHYHHTTILSSVAKCVQLFVTLDCSSPGSSVHGIIQASILEWVAIFSSRGSSQPQELKVSGISCIAGRFSYDRLFTI